MGGSVNPLASRSYTHAPDTSVSRIHPHDYPRDQHDGDGYHNKQDDERSNTVPPASHPIRSLERSISLILAGLPGMGSEVNGTMVLLRHRAYSERSMRVYRDLVTTILAMGRAGVEVALHPTDAGRLRHRPADLPPDLSARLRLHRAAILGLLVGGYTPDPHGDAGYVLGERLGVADGLAMPTHAGAPAWLLAVGESMGCSC